jgi:hypothetical protein
LTALPLLCRISVCRVFRVTPAVLAEVVGMGERLTGRWRI